MLLCLKLVFYWQVRRANFTCSWKSPDQLEESQRQSNGKPKEN